MAGSESLAATDDNFEEEVLQAELPVLVDFWAEWCGPCKMVGPLVDALAEEYDGRLKVMKLDVDSNPGIAQKYAIRSIPTLMIFKNGEPADTAVGVRPKPALQQFVEAHI